MGFLNPWMLAALGAIAVPVAIHLVAREPREGLPFPSLMFLTRVPLRERRQRHLRDRALLLARCLALALLALAFAGPYVQDPASAPQAGAERATVVALDRSYSMSQTGRWAAARDAARAALAGTAADGPAAVVLFDTEVELLTGDAGALTAALAAARPSARGTDSATGLEAAGRWLAEQPAEERRIVLVSDLQQTGLAEGRRIRLPAGVVVQIEPLPRTETANAAVVHAEAIAATGRSRTLVRGSIRSTGAIPVEAVEVALEVDGANAGRRTLALGPGGAADVAFEIATPVERAVAARLSLGADAIEADDSRHLVIAPRRVLRVLILARERGASPSAGFVTRALEVASEPRVMIRTVSPDSVDAAALADADVVVVDDLPFAGRWVDAVRARVDGGGGLLAFAGEGTRGTWPSGAAGLLPGLLGPGLERHDDPARLASGPGLPAGLENARIWRHRALEAGAADRTVVALEDGTPLVLERTRGAGRAAAIATTLAPAWSSLAREPGFVPLMHDLVRHLAGSTPPVGAHTVGDAVDLLEHARTSANEAAVAARLSAGAPVTVRTPSGALQPHPAGQPLRFREPGIHEVRTGAHAMLLAANVDPRESRLDALAAGAVEERVERISAERARSARDAQDARREEAGRWWWRLVLAATILLLVEAWLANRISRRRVAGHESNVGDPSDDEPARAI